MQGLPYIKSLLEKYNEINSDEDKNIGTEIRLLSITRELLEWNSYTDEEKHEKRKFVLRVIEKTDNAQEFVIETTVIESYELVKVVLYKIISVKDSHLKTRLQAMLDVFVLHTNEQRDTRYMQTSSFELITNITRQCLVDETFKSLHQELNKLVVLFENLSRLKFKKGPKGL